MLRTVSHSGSVGTVGLTNRSEYILWSWPAHHGRHVECVQHAGQASRFRRSAGTGAVDLLYLARGAHYGRQRECRTPFVRHVAPLPGQQQNVYDTCTIRMQLCYLRTTPMCRLSQQHLSAALQCARHSRLFMQGSIDKNIDFDFKENLHNRYYTKHNLTLTLTANQRLQQTVSRIPDGEA